MLVHDPNRAPLSPAQKARRINQNPDLYGTFAEIGGMYPRTGAQYAALRDAYGPAVGFVYVVCNATAIQAGAIESYAMMARVTGDARWLAPARKVAGYMLDMMRAPEGGFYTSQDADLRREGQEPVLGEQYYAMQDAERRALGLPIVDRNVYADLNGVMIRALVELYAATGDAAILDAAAGTAEQLLRTHRTDDGAFVHGAGDDREGLLYLRDQAAMGLGLVALYRATGQARWLEAATELGAFMRARLEDPEHGGFYAHTEDPAAVGVFAVRRKPVEENGMAARFLVALHRHLDGDGRIATPYREAAERALAAVGGTKTIEGEGRIIGELLLGLESVLEPIVDVTVVGLPGDPKAAALHLAALRYPEPRAVLEQSRPGERYPDIGKAAVYLCTESACSTPITDPDRLPALADEFLAVYRAAKLTSKVELLTLSYGSVASEFARLHPELINRMIVMAPLVVPSDRYDPNGKLIHFWLDGWTPSIDT